MADLNEIIGVLLTQHREEIIERGTDWVIREALDLRDVRPRAETRGLVVLCFEFYKDLLLGQPGGEQKRDDFIEFVTSYRVAHSFHISTLLRGFLAFRHGVSTVLASQNVAPETHLRLLALVDELYFASVFQMADVYVDKLKATIEERQQQLHERELQLVRLKRNMAESLLKRFLAPTIVEEVIGGQRSIDQKPRNMHVTVMFSDLVGFSKLAQILDSEELAQLLNQYLATMSEVIFFHRGTIDKFIGDSVMALFGAPVTMGKEEQALCSVRCAVDMQRAISDLDEIYSMRGVPPLAMRIGVDCGTAVVGNFGNAYRSDFTAIGAKVNRARHVQGICTPGEIFVTSDVAMYLPSELVEPVRSFQIKGAFGGVLCYRVLLARVN